MYRSGPGFIRRLLLHQVLLSERRARSVEVFLADSRVVVMAGAIRAVAVGTAVGLEAAFTAVIDKIAIF